MTTLMMSSKNPPHLDASAVRKNPELAIEFLAFHLRQGTLGLFLGAGVSNYLKLPNWSAIVSRCSTEVGLPELPPEAPASELCARMQQIEKMKSPSGKAQLGSSQEFRDLVHKHLYSEVQFEHILHGELLMALGSLIMGSKRGSVTEVFTLNFDDVLEWYLYLHGYQIQVVTSQPALRTAADVTIYHPHGFIPFHTQFNASDFLIFGQQSYNEKMGNPSDPWTEATRYFLKSKLVLFVGLSGEDPTFGPLFSQVQKSVKESRPIGVWLFTISSIPSKLTAIEDQNFIVLEMPNHDAWPNFLLSIAQHAADS
jgi:hypothetical protein